MHDRSTLTPIRSILIGHINNSAKVYSDLGRRISYAFLLSLNTREFPLKLKFIPTLCSTLEKARTMKENCYIILILFSQYDVNTLYFINTPLKYFMVHPKKYFLLNVWFTHMTPEHPQLGHHSIVVG